MSSIDGYLYCIGHPHMENIYKIGFTTRTPEERLAAANNGDTFKLPLYYMKYKKKVKNPYEQEKNIRKLLSEHGSRILNNREFWKIEYSKVLLCFDMIEGEEEKMGEIVKLKK